MLKPLVLSAGEPGGISPEITLKAWQALRESGPVFYVRGDAALYECPTHHIAAPGEAAAVFPTALPVLPTSSIDIATVTPGKAKPEHAPFVLASIRDAVADVQAGKARAVITNPVQKESLYESGFEFPGHTEYLGQLTNTKEPVMMLVCNELRVVPATIHQPLATVAKSLSTEKLVRIGTVILQSLQGKGISKPRLAVAGLNPHAGENGHIGTEEQTIIQPAIDILRGVNNDWTIYDPAPADTMFHAEARQHYDAVLCMYHDQALIPIKTIDYWGGVNVTLGLPILRTSPDHGTALELAGKGVARADSLLAAIKYADKFSAE